MTRNLLKSSKHPSLLESYPSCTLIPLDKNLGIRPIGVSEVLRRIIGKSISTFLKEEIDGHSAGAGTTIYIHAMAQIFDDDGTDGILLIDCNIQITCPEMSISSTRTEVPRDCSPVEGKRSYPRKGQHRVTLKPCHDRRSTHDLDSEPKSAYT